MSVTKKCLIAFGIALMAITNLSFAQALEGEIDYKTLIPIYSLHKGAVVDVPVDVGERVSANDILTEFDSTIARERLNILQSRNSQIEIEVRSLSDKFDRQQEMFDRGSLSLLKYEEAENELKTAEARLSAAQSKIAIAKHRVERATLRAPVDAIVVERNVHAGMNVLPKVQTEPLLVLAEYGNYVVRLQLDLENWLELKNTSSVNVSVNGKVIGVDLAGSVFRSEKSGNERVFIVELNFREESGEFYPGQSASIELM